MAGRRPLPVASLPYKARVYINNQVLIPARLARALGLNGSTAWVDVTLEHRGRTIELRGVRLLRSGGGGASRQFTIPRWAREAFGIRPLDEVTVVSIRPSGHKKECGGNHQSQSSQLG